MQEALTNILKHARAATVCVSVNYRLGEIRLIIEDDGVGFEPDAESGLPEGRAPSRPRLGLLGIQERLTLLGGTLTLEASPGAGTTLFVRIPVAPAA